MAAGAAAAPLPVEFVLISFSTAEDFVKKNVVVTAAAVLIAVVSAGPSAAQTTNPTPIARAIQQTPPFMTPGTRVDLSIEEAVARAREKNIDIGVARITPRLTDFTIAGLEANYRLNLTTSTNASKVATPAT